MEKEEGARERRQDAQSGPGRDSTLKASFRKVRELRMQFSKPHRESSAGVKGKFLVFTGVSSTCWKETDKEPFISDTF